MKPSRSITPISAGSSTWWWKPRPTLFPLQLLARVQKIERVLGRVRTVPKGPRIIDIDILLYGTAVMRGAKLEIPHPRMAERRFVLVAPP